MKLVRAAFGNNNVDTCARVCHSPTGYGLKTTLGESAGTQDFDSVEFTDCVIVLGANPTDGHPVFASRLKKRLREGANLIVIDPRQIELVRTPQVAADYHLQLRPGANVADKLAAMICQRFFSRFPKVRVATVECGSDWVDGLLKRLKKAYGQMPMFFEHDPVEQFKSKVWSRRTTRTISRR